MDFGFTDEQDEITGLARRILEDKVTIEVLRAAEQGQARFDRTTWDALGAAGLLGIGLPVDCGGGGFGLLEQCLVLEQVGRTVAPVPVAASSVAGAGTIARYGTDALRQRWVSPAADGSVILTAALAEPGNRFPERPVTTATPVEGGWRLDGVKTNVPAATLAAAAVVPATQADGTPASFVVELDAAGVSIEPQLLSRRDVAGRLTLDGVVVEGAHRLGGAETIDWLVQSTTIALCAEQLGVLSKAVEATAAYTTQRVQFDRPIATFQAVGQRMADAYIDVEGLRLTLWQALWRLEEGLPAATEVEVAKFWAAEAGHRVAHAAVHLHGGTGIDEDHPMHRYFLAAKAIELSLGNATHQLLRIGATFALTPD